MKTYLFGFLKRLGMVIGMPFAAIGVLLWFVLSNLVLSCLGPIHWLFTGKRTLLDKIDDL